MRFVAVAACLLLIGFAGCLTNDGSQQTPAATDEPPAYVRGFGDARVALPINITDAMGDVVVVAVVDGGFNPYHWDWAASRMPQHMDEDPTNDLPLDKPPYDWLPGYPNPADFESFTRLDLTFDLENSDRAYSELVEQDGEAWGLFQSTGPGNKGNIAWIPNTKVVGLIDFGGGLSINSNAHGAKASSVAAGNLFGACPECLFVFVDNSGEAGMNWVMQQPWIDAVSNSYGFSLVNRDRLYSGSDIVAQRDASMRGQSIFFSAGNGQANTFTVPNTTPFSSQEGPDWITTVGAVSPGKRASYTGHGKPADVASIGSNYPSQGGSTVSGDGTFGGTSSATPTITGTYGRALWAAREMIPGPSRVQADGVVATGEVVPCGAAYADCELADGNLTARELRMRLYHGAQHTPAGMVVGALGEDPELPAPGEVEFLNEGHGSYFSRMDGDEAWLEEFARIVGPMDGTLAPLTRPAGEREYMIVDSYCRQEIWDLFWTDGYWKQGDNLPAPNPVFPFTAAWGATCDQLFPPN